MGRDISNTHLQYSVRGFHGPSQTTKEKIEVLGGKELEHLKLGIWRDNRAYKWRKDIWNRIW